METLKRYFPGTTADGRLYNGLVALFAELRERRIPLEHADGSGTDSRAIDRVMVDCGWKPEIVENAIRFVDPRLFVPCKGVAVGAAKTPMRLWPKRQGRVFGFHMIEEKSPRSALRSLLVDVNFFKTAVHEAFALTPGERGSASLWGNNAQAHRMFSEHLCAETAKLVEHASNKVVEWSPNVNRPDNHFFDTITYAFAAGQSLLGKKE